MFGLSAGAIGGVLYARRTRERMIARTRAAERRARGAERLAEIGKMTGGLAHEIKNPLSTIGLNAQLLEEAIAEANLPEDDRARFARRTGALRREVDRLRDILSDFLEYAGELRLEPAPVDLNEPASDLADFFLPQAEQQGVRLRAQISPGPLRAELDGARVKQAALNLLLNALQAITRSGAGDGPREIILATERRQRPGLEPEVVLRVTDTGPGMDEPTRERIFDPYFTTRPGGTGLGLPTARRIVEGLGGQIEVHAEAGRGTSVAMVFPELVGE